MNKMSVKNLGKPHSSIEKIQVAQDVIETLNVGSDEHKKLNKHNV